MHVPEGSFDTWLEAAGGNNNGSTTNDRTNYYEDLPSNALELALFLESDRMGFLLDDNGAGQDQRPARRREEREAPERDNQPYGQAFIELPRDAVSGRPSLQLVDDRLDGRPDRGELRRRRAFFRTYYVPNNASLVIAGDIDIAATRKLVEKWFSDVPAGKPVPPLTAPTVVLDGVKKKTITDRVQLPRLYLAWHTPALLKPGDAALDIVSNLLSGGKNSRLYKPPRLRAADRAGRQRRAAVAGARQQLRDHRDGAAGPDARQDPGGDRRGARQAARDAAGAARNAARAQPVRGELLSRHGARRRIRRQGQSAELLLQGRRQARLLPEGSGSLSRSHGGRHQGGGRKISAEGSTRGTERGSGREEVKVALVTRSVMIAAVIGGACPRRRPIAASRRRSARRRR